MQKGDITVFAETNFRNERRAFGIKTDDRRRHMYLMGKTGMGKSTMLENMIVSDIRAGHGLAVVDPHGDLVEKIIDYIPANRINDVIYFNPADSEFPIAFNIIEVTDPSHQHLVASGLVGVFKKIYAESWGPRLEYVLRNAILALLDYPGSTLLGIMRILVDKEYRRKVIEKVKDPVVRSFWVDEYAKYPDKFATEAIAPIQNKVGQFLSNSLIRNIVGQVKSAIDMRDIMDNRKILLVNLAKGRIGEDTAALLGAMMITKLQMAAMERIDMAEKDRKDFYLYVDEFQNFATDSFANILSEARKYRLNLIIAHQYIEQLNEVVRPAVFGNVGTLILFRIGAKDAEELESEFTPRFTIEDLVNLKKYDIYLKLMIDGVSSDPFSATTLRPLNDDEKTGNREKIIRVTHERYSKPKSVIEEKISRWTGMLEEQSSGEGAGSSEERPPRREYRSEPSVFRKAVMASPRSGVPLQQERRIISDRPRGDTRDVQKKKKEYPIVCDRCKKSSTVFFDPDPKKPIYCKECLKEVKSEKTSTPSKAVAPRENIVIAKKPEPIAPKNTPTIVLPSDAQGLSLKEVLAKDVAQRHHPRQEKSKMQEKPPEKPVAKPIVNDQKKEHHAKVGHAIAPGQKIQFD